MKKNEIEEKIKYLMMVSELIETCESRYEWFLLDDEKTGEKKEPDIGTNDYIQICALKTLMADLEKLAK